VGAELARRGYPTAFFLGNQPTYDLLYKGEEDFGVQVKGFAWSKPKSPAAKYGNWVLIHDLFTGKTDDLFIIVYVPKPPYPFEFYIATRSKLAAAEKANSSSVDKMGNSHEPFSAGVCYKNFENFRDRWEALPGPLGDRVALI
jgi:hypothetical protein